MYTAYFGLREKPFKLVPNPEYLFLSQGHEIAMAHLTYATDQGEGFVVLTGEVGTGKTTLCRNYLERLNDNTESAYIFNPNLEYEQLLATICNEFGIEKRVQGAKALLEQLYTFLIRKNSVDKKVVLVIDEAQSLSTENLELVRMLSNLETTRSKLLQIVLVGQPELDSKLESYELRQLAQRISLSYHLAPLSVKDTQAYIRHRLGVASQQRQADLFSTEACRMAYRFSKGIPRLINIVCDRALLTAYSHNQPKVSKRVMQTAIMELVSRGKSKSKIKRWPIFMGAGVFCLAMIFAAALLIVRNDLKTRLSSVSAEPAGEAIETPANTTAKTFKIPDTGQSDNKITTRPKEPAPAPATTGLPAALSPTPESSSRPQPESSSATVSDTASASVFKPSAEPPASSQGTEDHTQDGQTASIAEIIQHLKPGFSRKSAVSTLLSIWQQPRPNVNMIPVNVDDPVFFEIAARQYGLRNYTTHNNWDLVRKLELPAIVALHRDTASAPVYLTLTGWHNQTLRFEDSQNGIDIQSDFESVRPLLEGTVYIYWKNTIGYDMIISNGADAKAVLSVQVLLRQIGYDHVLLNSVFDAATRSAVLDFQDSHNLKVDGLVGALTKIMLLRESGTIAMPSLSAVHRSSS